MKSLSAFGLLPLVASASICLNSESAANPIRETYPQLTTGTINGTVLIVSAPLSYVRALIPSQYQFLPKALSAAEPNFPAGQWPILIQAAHDHDVGNILLRIPDFQRVATVVPFVDVLNDGYSSFRVGLANIISDSAVAIAGAAAYGAPLPVLGKFDPVCAGYKAIDGGIGLNVYKAISMPAEQRVVSGRFQKVAKSPYSMTFYRNVTNQPLVQAQQGGTICDNLIALWNSSISMGLNAPVPIQGNLTLGDSILPESKTFRGVQGMKVDLAFIENNYLACDSLQGYNQS